MSKKNFVFDTNVVLHDHHCIRNFQENDIYIPITVIEELDHFKKGNDQINYNARSFLRYLDRIANSKAIKTGISLGEKHGNLYIVVEDKLAEKLSDALYENTPDHRILSAAMSVTEKNPHEQTILVSKDINMRLKALAFGVKAEDYKSDQVKDVELEESKYFWHEKVSANLLDKFYSGKELTVKDVLKEHTSETIPPNSFFELKVNEDDQATICRTHGHEHKLYPIDTNHSFTGIAARNTEQAFALDILNDKSLSLVAVTGTSGTGKTLLAIASAIAQKDAYQQIIIARPIVSLSDKDIGFLPGGYEEKVGPYMQPIFDNINVIKDTAGRNSSLSAEIDEMIRTKVISIEALAYIRGRSLSNTICIIDEAQNLTPLEIKTIITRAGEGTKVIFTGDIYQIDSPYLDLKSNGLSYMIEKMSGQDFFAHINLRIGERSELSEIAAKLL